jgi:tetratricopeptide (TPR) repeat protein
MSEGVDQRIASLLAEGLELFGEDRPEQAAIRWREVLALDPEHQEARDYLESAGFAPSADQRESVEAARLAAHEALAEAASGDPAAALPRLRAAVENAPDDLEVQAAYELVRAGLYARYRDECLGRPRVQVPAEELLQFNLPPDAGFVLSLVDGQTGVADLVTVSGMDPFDVLHVLRHLEGIGVLEMVP